MSTPTEPVLSDTAWLRRELLEEPDLREYFEAVWDDVLVPLAGASRHPFERLDFVQAHLSASDPASQWRFQGLFGFGGKLVTTSDLRCSVSLHPDDWTEPRARAQELVNLALDELHRAYLRSGDDAA